MELFGAKLQYEAAIKYYKGVPALGYSRNRSKAFKLFKEAAEAGLVEVMVKVSEMYFDGEGCLKNFEESRKWLERASSKGSAEAQYRLGTSYLWQNKLTSLGCEYLEKAAKQGHVQAMFELGKHYAIYADAFEAAIQWLSMPVLNNDPDANYYLAQAYENKERYEYEQEHPFLILLDDEFDIDNDNNQDYDAYCKEINHDFKPSHKVYKLYDKALQLYDEEASFGSWRCLLEAARMYYYGIGCEENKEKAFTYYYRLAHQQEGKSNGDCSERYRIKAIINLAKMYELGICCEKNIDKCNELIEKNNIDKEWFKTYTIS